MMAVQRRRASPPKQGSGVIAVFRNALVQIGPSRGLVYALAGMALLTGLLETALLYFVARIAVAVTSTDTHIEMQVGPFPAAAPSQGQLATACGVLLLVLICMAYPTGKLAAKLSARTIVRARTRIIEAFLNAKWSARASDAEGYLQEVAGNYCRQVEVLVQQFTLILTAGLSLAVIGVGAIAAAPIPALIALASLLGLGLLLRPFSRQVRRRSLEATKTDRSFASRIAQLARTSQEIAAFDVARPVEAESSRLSEQVASGIARVRLMGRLVPSLFQYAAIGVVLGMIVAMTQLGPQSRQNVGAIALLLIRALAYARLMQSATHAGTEMSSYADHLESEIARLRSEVEPLAPHQLRTLHRIDFADVSFAYTPATPVLDHLSFAIEPGDAIGLVGASGGGKTTIVQLLMRLRQPVSGSIRIEGTTARGDHVVADLREVTPSSWSQLVSYVPQDNKLVAGTVADNIRFYRDGVTDAAVREAARAANLGIEIEQLSDGFDTLIGPGARDLSGGQRQRLGIARALAGTPAMLVLDEPTSALDSESENLVRETLRHLRGRVILVIVAHRPSTLELCNRRFTVSGGTITELAVRGVEQSESYGG